MSAVFDDAARCAVPQGTTINGEARFGFDQRMPHEISQPDLHEILGIGDPPEDTTIIPHSIGCCLACAKQRDRIIELLTHIERHTRHAVRGWS